MHASDHKGDLVGTKKPRKQLRLAGRWAYVDPFDKKPKSGVHFCPPPHSAASRVMEKPMDERQQI